MPSMSRKELVALGLMPAGGAGSSKYGVAKKEDRTYKGVVYHSKMEAAYAETLDTDPCILWWLRQVKVDLGPDTRWNMDFLVCDRTDGVFGAEVKGAETREWKRVRKLIEKYIKFPVLIVTAKEREMIHPNTSSKE